MTFLSPLSGSPDDGRSQVPVAVPAPPHFRPLISTPFNVRPNYDNDYVRQRGNSAAKESGLRYESQVQEFLLSHFSDRYTPSPYFHFQDGNLHRTIIPDGLLVDPSTSARTAILVEIKFSHMADAWWQMEKLYKPVLQVLYPHLRISCLEICRQYDPASPFPCLYEFVEDLEEFVRRPSPWGVFRWKR
jgi:hypothetical protein